MRIIEPGHVYGLRQAAALHGDAAPTRSAADAPEASGTSEGVPAGEQVVRFVRRRDGLGEKLNGGSDGILSQELLRVLIDRTFYLMREAPCHEDVEILGHLRAALSLYEQRAAASSVAKLVQPELASVCPQCQHIVCAHERHAETDLPQG